MPVSRVALHLLSISGDDAVWSFDADAGSSPLIDDIAGIVHDSPNGLDVAWQFPAACLVECKDYDAISESCGDFFYGHGNPLALISALENILAEAYIRECGCGSWEIPMEFIDDDEGVVIGHVLVAGDGR